jgi:BirA family transcriptional regulator, biotin operon repressor / biotin---[acetyl-CoA-carboxylase] ligase
LVHFEPLDVDRIEQARQNALIGKKIVLFKSTASTNDIAWKYAANPLHHGLCVLAESQRKGRGRRGRIWYSNPGQSILCSILLLNQSIEAELLTLTAAVATAEAVQAICKLPCRIKWPNDILLNGKKLAGVLVEKKTVKKQHQFVVGIGINCNQPAEFFQQHDLHMLATSLAIETGAAVNRTELACSLLDTFEYWLNKANRQSSIVNHQSPVIARWQQLSDLLGCHITLESDNHKYSGFCRGIDPAEGLIVQLDTGNVRIFHAAQTSILKM